MTRDELRAELILRLQQNDSERDRRKRRIDSVRPHDPVLAMRLIKELEAAEIADDQARVTLARDEPSTPH